MTTTGRKVPNYTILAVVSGIGFILIGLCFVVFVPCPSQSQYIFLRIILSIGIAGFSAIIPGFLRIKYKSQITAGGALGVLVMVFFFNPAQITTVDNCIDIKVKGVIQINNKRYEGVSVTLVNTEMTRITNELGVFEFSINPSLLNDSIDFLVRFQDSESSFSISSNSDLDNIVHNVKTISPHSEKVIFDNGEVDDWVSFPDELGSKVELYIENQEGIAFLKSNYELVNNGWVIIERALGSDLLKNSSGIKFRYRGTGFLKVIEVKLAYGDIGETTFGISLSNANNTTHWKDVELNFSDFDCWWPEGNCLNYRNELDVLKVRKLQFAISAGQEGSLVDGSGTIDISRVITY